MSASILILANLTLLGTALMAGLFFAFSTFIMKALSEIPSDSGVSAMRSINRVIINPWFLGPFMGTTVASIILGILALVGIDSASNVWFMSAAACNLFGTFLTTGIRNVPLNKKLDAVADSEAEAFWQHYLKQWTRYNHIRTISSSLAVIFCGIGLMQF